MSLELQQAFGLRREEAMKFQPSFADQGDHIRLKGSWTKGGKAWVRVLPDYVRQEFDEYLKCGRLEHGFLRVQCETCHAEHLVAFSCTNSRRFRRY